jgi:hypothetical protein
MNITSNQTTLHSDIELARVKATWLQLQVTYKTKCMWRTLICNVSGQDQESGALTTFAHGWDIPQNVGIPVDHP